MLINLTIFLATFGFVINVESAAIDNFNLYEEPRISSSNQLLDTIVDKCFCQNVDNCLKEKILNYLDTLNYISTESARSLDNLNIDKVIFDRVARILKIYEFRLQLPANLIENTEVSFRADRGLDIILQQKEEGRGSSLKKKVILPVLLLLKLKLKALIPVMIAFIGIKAMKALILSKIAIKLVLAFLIYNLIQKIGGLKMTMMPIMTSSEQMSSYGIPQTSTQTPYESNNWEPAKDYGSPYARVWSERFSRPTQQLAYSSYFPSGSLSSSSQSASPSAAPSVQTGSSLNS